MPPAQSTESTARMEERPRRRAGRRYTHRVMGIGHSAIVLAAQATAPSLVLDLLIVLTTAGLVALAMSRAKLAAAPAYIIAGAIIGPDALALASTPDSLDGLAQLATVLLLFGIGLQLHIASMRNALGRYIAAGVGSGAVTTLLGWPLGMALGMTPAGALVTSMALSLSSTAVVMQYLAQRRELNRGHARLALAILVIQDVAVIGMLAAIPVLAAWTGTNEAAADPERSLVQFALISAGRVILLGALVVVARWLLPRLLAEATRGRGMDVLLVIATAAAIGSAAGTQALGFSPELGAFLAGLTLAASPVRHQISGQVGPLRDLFIAIFFTTIGMRLSPNVLIGYAGVILLALGATLLIKSCFIGLLAWMVGAGGATAIIVGFLLAQAGEFSLLLLAAAERAGIIDPDQFRVTAAVVVLSLIVTPGLAWAGRRIAPRGRAIPLPPWLRGRINLPAEPDAEEKPRRRVIIGGFGPVGQSVAEALRGTSVEHVVVELNPYTVDELNKRGIHAIYGDVANPQVLEHAGAHDADALVLTIPDEEAAVRASHAISRMRPGILIVARATLASRTTLANLLGAEQVVVDEQATAKAMRDLIVSRFGAS